MICRSACAVAHKLQCIIIVNYLTYVNYVELITTIHRCNCRIYSIDSILERGSSSRQARVT